VSCWRNKTEQLHLVGLLLPLEIPFAVWVDIAMDFIEGFPKIDDKSIILTVLDWFSKYAHFIPLSHPYTTIAMTHAFFFEIARLHGIPCSIVSDRDPIFTSSFW
jgi:hypothetical protein